MYILRKIIMESHIMHNSVDRQLNLPRYLNKAILYFHRLNNSSRFRGIMAPLFFSRVKMSDVSFCSFRLLDFFRPTFEHRRGAASPALSHGILDFVIPRSLLLRKRAISSRCRTLQLRERQQHARVHGTSRTQSREHGHVTSRRHTCIVQ